MKPKSYFKLYNKTCFVYDPKEYLNWRKSGEQHGDVGFILVAREGNAVTFGGFGTIEHPSYEYSEITTIRNPLFDDKPAASDDEIIQGNLLPDDPSYMTTSFHIIDFSKNGMDPLINENYQSKTIQIINKKRNGKKK